MRLEDFSYNYLIQNFKESFDKWNAQLLLFDDFLDIRIKDSQTRTKIKSIAKKLRNQTYTFTKSDLEDIKLFIKNTDNIFHCSQWTANFNSEIKLNGGVILDHVLLFNKIKSSDNLSSSGLNYIFSIKTYNAHFPHLFSIVKNVQDENRFPVNYPHWQQIYKWLKNEKNCSYDQLCDFYRNFIVPDNLNKYKTFGGAINAFHVEYLKWCLNTNKNYNTIDKSKMLLKSGITKMKNI